MKFNGKTCRKKGFTLLEMVIAMQLLLIVSTMIMALIFSITKSAQRNNREGKIYSDLFFSELAIKNWFNKYDEYKDGEPKYDIAVVMPSDENEGEYKLSSSAEGQYMAVFQAETDISESFTPEAVVYFNEEYSSIVFTDRFGSVLLESVNSITFYKGENAARVSIKYDGGSSPYVLIIAFGRNKL